MLDTNKTKTRQNPGKALPTQKQIKNIFVINVQQQHKKKCREE